MWATRTKAISLRCYPWGYPADLVRPSKDHCVIFYACVAKTLVGGRTRTRTWDPLIKSHLFIAPFQRVSSKKYENSSITHQWVRSKKENDSAASFTPEPGPCAERDVASPLGRGSDAVSSRASARVSSHGSQASCAACAQNANGLAASTEIVAE